ncbi:hypothetical protein OIO90_004353 [Microbotryomycetes sp. JL221]|nr:hypothetical protein OIO90_004353 [Microbotryomycetes sp. JL221]
MAASSTRTNTLSSIDASSDADPAVLSDYVLALLKHDGSVDDLKASCHEQLVDFLGDETPGFVAQLFFRLTAPRSLARLDKPHPVPPRPMKRAASPDVTQEKKPLEMQIDDNDTSTNGSGQQQGVLCRDYHERGFCARGGACPYQHDGSSIPLPMSNMPWAPFWGMSGGAGPSMGGPGGMPFFPGAGFPGMPPPGMGGMPPFMHGNMNEGPNKRQRTRTQAPRDGTARVLSDVTIAIENIPADFLNEQIVKDYFEQFGQVVKAVVDPPQFRSLVTFKESAQAKAALSSPQAVFGNRFVRIYRAKLPTPAKLVEPVPVVDTTLTPTSSKPTSPKPFTPRSSFKQTSSTTFPRKTRSVSAQDRAFLLEQNAKVQKLLFTKLETTKEESEKQRVMTELRKLSKEAKLLRQQVAEAAAVVAPPKVPAMTYANARSVPQNQVNRENKASGENGGEPTPEETLARLRAEAAALGIPSDA